MQHAMNFICFSFPRALQLPCSEGGKSEAEQQFHTMEGLRGRKGGRKQEAEFVGKTLETP